jgi:hypothetical protein
MDSPTVLKRFNELVAQFGKEHGWGTVTVEFRGGAPCYIETKTTEKITCTAQEALAHGFKPVFRTR